MDESARVGRGAALSPQEERKWAEDFGVSTAAIRHDHLISHLLLALSYFPQEDLVFYGGTALTRTHLAGLRLSEDIDLQVQSPQDVAGELGAHLVKLLRRDFPDSVWEKAASPAGQAVRYFRTPEDLSVRVQLVEADKGLPVDRQPVQLSYSGLPATVELTVPTLVAFGAMKTMAYTDRWLPRDLVDLRGLAALGALTLEAADLLRRIWGYSIVRHDFDKVRPRTAEAWETELAHLMANVPSPEECLAPVRAAWAATMRWE